VLQAGDAADQLDQPACPVHSDPVAQRHRLGRADRGEHPAEAEQQRDHRDALRGFRGVARERTVDEQPVAERVTGAGHATEDEQHGDQGHPTGRGAEAVEEQDPGQPRVAAPGL
jgi:hypothetical protein